MLLNEDTLKDMVSAKKALLYNDLKPIDVFMDVPDLPNSILGDFEPLDMWLDKQFDNGHSDRVIIKYLAYILYGSADRLTMNRAALYVEHKPATGFDPMDFLIKTTRLGGCRLATRRELIIILNMYINDKRNY